MWDVKEREALASGQPLSNKRPKLGELLGMVTHTHTLTHSTSSSQRDGEMRVKVKGSDLRGCRLWGRGLGWGLGSCLRWVWSCCRKVVSGSHTL